MEYRKDIQGLRTIAVISVWLFHLHSSILPGGFIGVDIFFVISGFLISSIILFQKENNKFSFVKFYISRIKRIIPAYYIFLFIITIAVIFIYLPTDIDRYRSNLIYSLIFDSNNHFSKISNYFGAKSTENPLLHTWTLSIEMQFYVFLPLLIIFFNRKKSLYLSIVICIFLYAYTQYQILFLGNQGKMYFSLLARIPEFLLGVILSLSKWNFSINKKTQSIFGIVGLLLIILSLIFINSETLFPGIITLIPCGGAILILMNKDGIVNNKLLSNKLMVYVGELSYSIYLWHWGILALLRYRYVEYDLSLGQYLFSIILTIILSVLSYYFVEVKYKKYTIPKLVFRFSIYPIILVCIILFMKNISSYLYKEDFPLNITSPEVMGFYDNHNFYNKDIIQGDLSSKDTILLLGNSHGLVLKPFLDYTGRKYNFAFRSITNDSNPTIPGLLKSFFSNEQEYNRYKSLIDIVEQKIKNTKVIIIGTTFTEERTKYDFIALKYLREKLLKEEQSIIIVSDFPTLDKNPLQVNRSILKSKSKQTEFKLTEIKPSLQILDYIKKGKNMYFLDLSNSAAFNDAPFYNDTLMYYDASHINKYGSLIYAKYSGREIGELVQFILKEKK